MESLISRREALQRLALCVATAAAPSIASATSSPRQDWRRLLLSGERTITLRRDGVCAAETLRYVASNGNLDVDGYTKICLVLRDVRAGRVYPISVKTLDILCGLQRWGAANGRHVIINALSGFRTYATNNATEGAAKGSLHMQGRAIDFGFDGMATTQASAMAVAYNDEGGVGLYPARNFIHADDGSPRIWVDSRSRRG